MTSDNATQPTDTLSHSRYPALIRIGVFVATTAAIVAFTLFGTGFLIANVVVGAVPNLHRDADFSFELPKDWRCILEGTEWVCQLDQGELKRAAIIIFAKKYRGTDDGLEEYEAHLRQPRELNDPDGRAIESTVLYVKRVRRGTHTWIDGKHFQSEVPGYYTRYLASTTAEVAVLVTYSVAKDFVERIEPDLDQAFESLRFHQRN